LATVHSGSSFDFSDKDSFTAFIALDTSGSAAAKHEEFFGRAKQLISKLPENDVLYLYRFDSSPAEVYSQPKPESEDDISALLKECLTHTSNTPGTNLAKLFQRWDRLREKTKGPVQMFVFTDCGTEEMTRQEQDTVRGLVKQWDQDERVVGLHFVGVSGGNREEIQNMVEMDKFDILR
jgi:hypothetical protein